jgi:hypothetical protein
MLFYCLLFWSALGSPHFFSGVHVAQSLVFCAVFGQQLFIFLYFFPRSLNRVGVVMVSVLISSAVDREFEPQSSQTKDYKIGNCCLSTKYAEIRRKSKACLARNHDNVSEWGDMSIC